MSSLRAYGEQFAEWQPAEHDALNSASFQIEIRGSEEASPRLPWFDEGRLVGQYQVSDAGALVAFVPDTFSGVRSVLEFGVAAAAWRAGGLLLHGTGLERGGIGCIGLAPSGGGKSTLSVLAGSFECLSDETVFVRVDEQRQARIWGTPFQSSAPRRPQQRSARLGALLFLEKSLEPGFRPMETSESMSPFLKQIFRPPLGMASSALLLKRSRQLLEVVSAYRFAFPKAPEAETLLERLFHEQLG